MATMGLSGIILLFAIAQGVEWRGETYPNPLLQFKQCGNPDRSPICDPDRILTAAEKQSLEQAIRPDIKDAECDEKPPLILVIFATELKMKKGESKTETQEKFAGQIAKKFKADKRCKSEIILTVGVENQQFYAVANQNAGIMGAQISEFFKNTIPLFREGNYSAAIEEIIENIYIAVDQNHEMEKLWTAETFPNPLEDPERCGNSRPISVCDPDQMLPLSEKENLNMFVKSMEEESRQPESTEECDREGLRFLVVLTESIKVPHGLSNDTAQMDFTQQLPTSWSLTPSCNNLVLVTLSRDNKQFYTAASEKVGLKPEQLKSFFLKNVEKFQAEKYKDGIAGVIWDVTRTYLVSKKPEKRR